MTTETNQNSFLNNIFKIADDQFWCVTIKGNGEQVDFSDSVETVTGYEIDELKKLPGQFFCLIHEDDIQLVKDTLSKINSNKDLTKVKNTYRIKKKNGDICWLKESMFIERDTYKDIKKTYSIFTDITELKNSELVFNKTKEELVELNKTKDRFISIVSHDLRAPFTSLLGFSEILMNEPNLPYEERTEYLSYIFDASKTQLQLINHLLDWSRLQTGKIQIEPKRISAKTLISNAVSILTGAAMRKNIEIKTDIKNDLYLSADERLLGQAVSNLLSNAIKFTPENKKIYINAGKFKEGLAEIVIRDEGTGIKEEHQEKLFKIDKKYSTEGTNGEKGSGLGLTLVKEIIEKHNGDVWFYSKPGEGSEFHITVPEAKDLVVIVEDEKVLLDLYKMLVKKVLPNFEIIEAENGYEALTIIVDRIPSLIITDHDMPLMNGIQLVEAMRKKSTNNKVPVVVISAKFNDDIIKKYKELGVNTLLKKPFEQIELLNIIKESVE
ncbi:MAG: ATP-binding protein [Ignavibacteria bacterium]|jgi:PAS domain S-box-containing protein